METQPNIPSTEQWIAHLESLIAEPLSPVPFDGSDEVKEGYIDSFRDEYGSKRATDRALLSRVLGVGYEPRSSGREPDLDERLWDATHDVNTDWRKWVRGVEGSKDGLVSDDYAIEHRTLIELSSLHALWHLGDREVVEGLVRWHTRELQPDNGINRPWGVHVFVACSVESDDTDMRLDAMLHAQTLVNNCCVNLGRPDVLSAFILRDSTDALRAINE
ncbi:MAG: hypothetical protein JJ974_10220 [Phycisphaerales bacterium]|nr:hypothetical protein [Phycisphaerales bacterium]